MADSLKFVYKFEGRGSECIVFVENGKLLANMKIQDKAFTLPVTIGFEHYLETLRELFASMLQAHTLDATIEEKTLHFCVKAPDQPITLLAVLGITEEQQPRSIAVAKDQPIVVAQATVYAQKVQELTSTVQTSLRHTPGRATIKFTRPKFTLGEDRQLQTVEQGGALFRYEPQTLIQEELALKVKEEEEKNAIRLNQKVEELRIVKVEHKKGNELALEKTAKELSSAYEIEEASCKTRAIVAEVQNKEQLAKLQSYFEELETSRNQEVEIEINHQANDIELQRIEIERTKEEITINTNAQIAQVNRDLALLEQQLSNIVRESDQLTRNAEATCQAHLETIAREKAGFARRKVELEREAENLTRRQAAEQESYRQQARDNDARRQAAFIQHTQRLEQQRQQEERRLQELNRQHQQRHTCDGHCSLL